MNLIAIRLISIQTKRRERKVATEPFWTKRTKEESSLHKSLSMSFQTLQAVPLGNLSAEFWEQEKDICKQQTALLQNPSAVDRSQPHKSSLRFLDAHSLSGNWLPTPLVNLLPSPRQARVGACWATQLVMVNEHDETSNWSDGWIVIALSLDHIKTE